MGKHFKHPATAIATVALFAALGGGAVAYAGGLISGSQIKSHSIPANKLTKSAVKTLQGSSGKILTYNATAVAGTPAPTTIGTVLGVTFGATCINTGGDATLNQYVKTSDGSWSVDFSNDAYDGSSDVYISSAAYPAGTITVFTKGDSITALAGDHQSDKQFEAIQLKPLPGTLIWHMTAQTTPTPSATCHWSIEAFPGPSPFAVAGANRVPSGVTHSHLPLRLGGPR